MRQELSLPQLVCEYEDVFLEELPGLPPYRDVDFTIELHPGTSPISMTPHRMAPIKLQELKVRLQELLDKGFIKLNTSRWGALILFAKKKDKTLRLCIDYRRFKNQEQSYPTLDMEFVAIVFALKIWGHYLYGEQFEVLSYHKSMKYIFT